MYIKKVIKSCTVLLNTDEPSSSKMSTIKCLNYQRWQYIISLSINHQKVNEPALFFSQIQENYFLQKPSMPTGLIIAVYCCHAHWCYEKFNLLILNSTKIGNSAIWSSISCTSLHLSPIIDIDQNLIGLTDGIYLIKLVVKYVKAA